MLRPLSEAVKEVLKQAKKEMEKREKEKGND